jgi:tripartite-type tricarboxylate transporter receptor subunit TctC
MRRSLGALALVASFIFPGLLHAASDPVADFYRGKQIKILISTPVGTGYDTYARLLARHLGNFIPGKPAIIPQNMASAGGVTVANSAYNRGPFDGTLIFTLHFTLPLYQAMGGDGVKFDAAKMQGIGRLLASNVVIGVGSKSQSGVTTFEDALHKTATIGSTSATSNATIFPTILNRMAGTKFKVVSGYEGEGAVFLAMERGEIDGFGSYSYLTFKSVRPDYLTKKLFHPIVQWGVQREAAWQDVPTAIDVAKTEADKRAMKIVSAGSDIGFSYFMPPGVPQDRAAALQKAFEDMIKDPGFLADAQQGNLVLRTASASDIEHIVQDVLTAPPDVIRRVSDLMKLDGAD